MEQNGQIDKIADAFQKHFLHYGFKKTNVDEVASELRISKKTIYELFPSKEHIFEHVINRMASKRVFEMKQYLKREKTYRGKIGKLVDSVFAHRREMHINGNHHLKDKHESEIAHNIFRKAFHEFAEDLIVNGFVNGEFKSEMLQEHLIPFILSVVSEGISLQETYPERQVEKDVKVAIFKLLDCNHC